MSLLDKVSGELNLYIGGYVTHSCNDCVANASGERRTVSATTKKVYESDCSTDCSLFVERNLFVRLVSLMYFRC